MKPTAQAAALASNAVFDTRGQFCGYRQAQGRAPIIVNHERTKPLTPITRPRAASLPAHCSDCRDLAEATLAAAQGLLECAALLRGDAPA